MTITWHEEAWEQYSEWEETDKKNSKRIKQLIKDIFRNGNSVGIGDPEPLKGDLSGLYSRRIDKFNRLVYLVIDDKLEIYSCKGHYDKR